jgi:hypothetical protein
MAGYSLLRLLTARVDDQVVSRTRTQGINGAHSRIVCGTEATKQRLASAVEFNPENSPHPFDFVGAMVRCWLRSQMAR